jgi:hypothetical protein
MSSNDSRSPFKRTAIIASVAAVIAVIVAIGASTVAFMALSRSGSSSDSAVGDPESATGGGDDGDETAQEPSEVTGSTKEPTPVRPAPDFDLAYEKVLLKIPASGGCTAYVDIDVDGPRINSGSADFTRYRCSRPDAFEFNNVAVSADAATNTTPLECMEKIELSPLREGAELPVSSVHVGDALCIRTDRNVAIELGLPQRVALLEFRGVDDDGTLAVLITAWNVPD